MNLSGAYYNEIDPYAAEWLRNLIKAGHIADGVVDERSIEDVRPDDIRGFTQCHFFAGIGVWSAALRRARWPDSRAVWTGSEPCQPYSSAGKGLGSADERYLRPSFQHLIEVCRPTVIFGEQVASPDALYWLDTISSDLEGNAYAFGAVIAPSAGFGAPHRRDRLNWAAFLELTGVGQADAGELGRGSRRHRTDGPKVGEFVSADRRGAALDELADPKSGGCRVVRDAAREGRGRYVNRGEFARGLADAVGAGCRVVGRGGLHGQDEGRDLDVGHEELRPGPVNGFWRNADWIFCRDGRWRPIESGTSPLVNGDTSRMGRLRAYGNAINLEQSAHFIVAADDAARSLRLSAGA